MSYLLKYNPGTPQYTYPRRGGAKLSGTAIIHTAECAMDLEGDDSSAEVCASFIANRADYGSYHRLVDSDSIIDMVPWEYEAWQDSETNNWAVGISAAVQAGKWNIIPAARRDRIYRNMAACAADFVRHMATKGVTVPLVRISGAQARARVPGFCAHGDSGLHRSDPGIQFDWALFFRYTAEALGGNVTSQSTTTAPKEWDEMASKEEIKEAFREVAKEGPAGRDIGWYVMHETPLPGWNGNVSASARIAGTDQAVNDIRALLAAQNAIQSELVKALAAVTSGEDLDQDKLLAGVRAEAEAGVRSAIKSITTTTTAEVKES